MTVTVISISGLSTDNAVIRTKHTREDAISFCRDYVQKLTEDCIKEELETPLNDFVNANCTTGEFTDFRGDRYQFLGPNQKKNDEILAKYLIRNLSTNEIANGSSASGYPTNMSIFKALCPRQAPFDF